MYLGEFFSIQSVEKIKEREREQGLMVSRRYCVARLPTKMMKEGAHLPRDPKFPVLGLSKCSQQQIYKITNNQKNSAIYKINFLINFIRKFDIGYKN